MFMRKLGGSLRVSALQIMGYEGVAAPYNPDSKSYIHSASASSRISLSFKIIVITHFPLNEPRARRRQAL